MTHYNPAYVQIKHAAYGCNCNLLTGDRPMTQAGHGQPIDELDSVCKSFKQCLRCVTEYYGSECIGEMIWYNFEILNEPICTDSAGTCERALCECDKEFAKDHGEQAEIYNPDFSHIFAMFDYEEICRKLGYIFTIFFDFLIFFLIC